MIEKIEANGAVLALVVRAGFRKEGIEFFTPSDYSQQLAYMNRPKGYRIVPHVHNEVHRDVFLTQEVLFIRTGRVKVDFYDERRQPVCETVLEPGDVILLATGGDGFCMLESTEMIEVKQGPYAGDRDKTRFDPETGANI